MNRKKLVIGAAAAATLALGGGGAAIAAQQAAEDEATLKDGSVAAPAASGGENEAAGSEAGQARDLQQLTRIDRAAAEEAALGAVPGEANEVELENEGGFVVFEVEVAGDDGKLHEVVVDAGNGEILGGEIEEGED